VVSRWNVNCKNLAVQLELNQYPKSNAPAADTHAQRWRLIYLYARGTNVRGCTIIWIRQRHELLQQGSKTGGESVSLVLPHTACRSPKKNPCDAASS